MIVVMNGPILDDASVFLRMEQLLNSFSLDELFNRLHSHRMYRINRMVYHFLYDPDFPQV